MHSDAKWSERGLSCGGDMGGWCGRQEGWVVRGGFRVEHGAGGEWKRGMPGWSVRKDLIRYDLPDQLRKFRFLEAHSPEIFIGK